MVKQHRNLFNWRSSLGSLIISLGLLSVTKSPVKAIPPQTQSSFELAQVGVRSRIDRPTPLNLRPRTHIPLPTVRGSRYGSYSRYPNRDRYYDGYGHSHDRDRTHPRRSRHRRGPVIIINPSNYFEYSNYDSYIRVIGR